MTTTPTSTVKPDDAAAVAAKLSEDEADCAPMRLRSCVYEGPRSAVYPLAQALEIDTERALNILRTIVGAGFVIAPREPTDAMLVAYFDAYGERPYTPGGVVRGIGKARLRWREMGRAGTAVALSTRYPPSATTFEAPHDTGR